MQQWPIATRTPKDEYGDELPLSRDYVDTDIPEQYHTDADAMRYVEPWRMGFDDIMAMGYVEFVRRTLVFKAITMRRPTKTYHDKIMRNTMRRR